jgi:hypothetical protein
MSYTWSTQKSFDENKILEFLPPKMRTDIAMRVHFSTLGKVKLFRNCEPGKSRVYVCFCNIFAEKDWRKMAIGSKYCYIY